MENISGRDRKQSIFIFIPAMRATFFGVAHPEALLFRADAHFAGGKDLLCAVLKLHEKPAVLRDVEDLRAAGLAASGRDHIHIFPEY